MSRGINLNPMHIRYKGIFDFPEIWRLIGDWFVSKGFEIMETKAKHKSGSLGEEMECGLFAWRNVTDYYRFEMRAFVKYYDGQPVEVVKNGEKKKVIKARVYFRINGKLVLDYSDRYEKSRMIKQLGKFLNDYVLKWQWESIYGDQLHYKMLELHNVIKEYLNMTVTGSEYADMW